MPTTSRERCSVTLARGAGAIGSSPASDPPDHRPAAGADRAAHGRVVRDFGRPSIPPEKLLRALLLQALYTVRSERQLIEQLDYNLLFRWFVGLGMDDAVWAPTRFTKIAIA
jgi:hypothetical protein